MVGHAEGNRNLQDRFRYSGETVSRHLHKVLPAFLKLFMEYIRPLYPLFRDSHAKIENDT